MKRNLIFELEKWGNNPVKPFFLYGLNGVGKTYLCNEYARDFTSSFFYFKPETNSVFLEKINNSSDPMEVLKAYFLVEEDILNNNLLILDNAEKYQGAIRKILETYPSFVKLIIVSEYNFLTQDEMSEVFVHKLLPMEFDEFITATGNDWYIEAIRGHFESRKALPALVSNKLLSDFEEYIWVGGMPQVVLEYVNNRDTINVTTAQQRMRKTAFEFIEGISDTSLQLKVSQVAALIEKQLYKSNQKFKFNMIRQGVTYQMYEEALDLLKASGSVLKIDEINDNKKIKLYYPEFSYYSTERCDELTEVEYNLRVKNYILQSLSGHGFEVKFWDSGNKAQVDYCIKKDDGFLPVQFNITGINNSKSITSFEQHYNTHKSLKICDSNFVDNSSKKQIDFQIPLYALFCLDSKKNGL